MKIEIKNLKYMASMSHETNCFSCDVWINGKKAISAYNEGHGGRTFYRPYKGMEDLMKQAEEWAKSQPEHSYKFKGEEFCFPNSLEIQIDKLVEEQLICKENEKFKKKKEKDMLTALILWKPEMEDNRYRFVTFGKPKIPIAELLKKQNGINTLKQAIAKYKAEGYTIRNTNLNGLNE